MTVLRASWLFDGVSSLLLRDRAVVLEGGRIVAVDRAVDAPRDALDLRGATLMPGMIDTHVHLCLDAGEPADALVSGRTALLAGVTTVRDLGDLPLTVRGRPGVPTIVAAGSPVTTVADVRDRAERGCDVIMVTDPTNLATVVDEAHRHGLPVTALARDPATIRTAVESGVDGLEHADHPHSIQALADRRVVVGAGLPRMSLTTVRAMYDAGVPIVPGTDAGTVKPHDVLAYAVPQLREIGMSPAESLRAVTSVGASVCRLAHRKGRLAPGFDADVIAVDGNPLDDPLALLRIRAVYALGVRYR